MNVILFKNRFEPLILAGIKSLTIRAHRKDGRPRAKAGERVSLRVWTGKPYWSKQREFAQATVEHIEAVSVHHNGVSEGDGTLRAFWMGEHNRMDLLNAFSRSDGFANWAEMKAFFQAEHGLPFEGSMAVWKDLVPTKA